MYKISNSCFLYFFLFNDYDELTKYLHDVTDMDYILWKLKRGEVLCDYF